MSHLSWLFLNLVASYCPKQPSCRQVLPVLSYSVYYPTPLHCRYRSLLRVVSATLPIFCSRSHRQLQPIASIQPARLFVSQAGQPLLQLLRLSQLFLWHQPPPLPFSKLQLALTILSMPLLTFSQQVQLPLCQPILSRLLLSPPVRIFYLSQPFS